MNGRNMEGMPVESAKTRRRKGHCPAGARLGAVACEDEFNSQELEALFQNYKPEAGADRHPQALAVLHRGCVGRCPWWSCSLAPPHLVQGLVPGALRGLPVAGSSSPTSSTCR
ncbi:hypothetical protein KUCAC02_022753 [Chaenocephalus aceratus]|uniref:Uncharacterized protein n=1 Tax=Chaenocephalus aceratus TaxID=36190 RepID=A0ACB9XQC7_CHAAC|nr:hypothetical protein KUCAC02_022753 [Chaenocephalus aceratus]